jgi:hypothetical protein
MTGNDYAKWVDNEDKRHQALMKEAGFFAGPALAVREHRRLWPVCRSGVMSR